MKTRSFLIIAASFLYTSLGLQSALGDDTEIYVSRQLPEDQQVRPNLLFIIDNSGSMDAAVAGTTCPAADRNIRNRCVRSNNTYRKTRMQVVKDVTNELIDELQLSNDVNIGLMHFDFSRSDNGGMVAIPVGRVGNVATSFKSELNSLYAGTNTPLSETYYEAAMYMKGLAPKFGNNTVAVYEDGNSYRSVNKPSVAGSKNGSNYLSPIQYSCQKSNIILLTDGAPTQDTSANSDIKRLVSVSGAANTLHPGSTCGSSNGECMPHLAEHLANQDISTSQPGKQTVNTYTIGFATNQTLLQNTATAGNGRYFTTDNTSGLVDALKSILVEILAENTTFANPSVAVSAYNNLGYRNDMYYALFRPAEGARWVGNVKRYKLITDSSNNAVIVDKNGLPAVDDSTGFFKESASSYWSNLDGKDVGKGGVGGVLPEANNRNIYTWTKADRSPTASAGVTGSASITDSANLLSTANSALTNALMGVASDTDKTAAITWGRGLDPATNQHRRQVADVLHNEPRLVAYATDEDLERLEAINAGGSQVTPEQLYMFFGTNEGFIHAVDPKTGIEKFAFIPKELLPNLSAYHKNAKGSDAKRYGMDGQFNLWTEYGPVNTNTKSRPITKSILYAGMRRGGRNYYALDVLNINAPALKWVIKGGTTPGYEKLGQTWSTPKLANVKVNGTTTKVLIFTGGYDPQQDIDSPNTPLARDTYGNSLYIVNAETGQLIWRAGHNTEAGANLQLETLTHSMPADPLVIDIDSDGLTDIIYAVDSRAQIFRFDINNANSGVSNLATGGRIANLGGSDALNNRRFFNSPDVALVRDRGEDPYLAISIGSGYRAHPLNEDTIDRFYVLKDKNVYTKPAQYTSITENDLVDASSVNLTDAEAARVLAEIATKEAQITTLNNNVNDARDRFAEFKDSSGFTDKYNAMLQANTNANDRQAAMDLILAENPFVTAHAPESSQQSQLQDGLLSAQTALAALKQATDAAIQEATLKNQAYEAARVARDAASAALVTAQANLAADPGNNLLQDAVNAAIAAESSAETAYQTASAALTTAVNKKDSLSNQTNQLASVYDSIVNLQDRLSQSYQSVLNAEAALTEARATGADDDTQRALTEGLESAREAYQTSSDAISRLQLNEGNVDPSINLQSLLSNINQSLSNNDLAAMQVALDSLTSLSGSDGSLSRTVDDLLGRDEVGKAAELTQAAENDANNVSVLNSLEAQRLAFAGEASTAQAQANAITNQPYGTSTLLTAAQLQAAKLLYGDDITLFEAYQYLIDTAQANTLDPSNGLPALRAAINSLYSQLTPGNSYVPNHERLKQSSGWFLRLPKGEKVLSSPLIFRGAVFFSTFSPRGETVTTCGPDVGRGRSYVLNLTDASGILTQSGTLIRSYALVRSGIPPSPAVVFRDNAPPAVIVGTEILGDKPKCTGENCPTNQLECTGPVGYCDKTMKNVNKTYWREN
ncbi:PilC/PilY family type IV pilus protein [Ectopseudomonas mendocina]|uniref:PilC/PilY family type IV pilus protein n=1 Tax=Ectopseudomonas mendocina TaxID=300 RepID=A0ABZ2RLU4_ECTME